MNLFHWNPMSLKNNLDEPRSNMLVRDVDIEKLMDAARFGRIDLLETLLEKYQHNLIEFIDSTTKEVHFAESQFKQI